MFSSGQEDHQINDQIEYPLFKSHEDAFRYEALTLGLACYAGFKRTLFGLAQIVGTLFFVMIRSCQAGYTSAVAATDKDKQYAALYGQEVARSFTYFGHGLANIGRGIAEFLHIAVVIHTMDPHALRFRYQMRYPSEIARTAFHADTASSRPRLESKSRRV